VDIEDGRLGRAEIPAFTGGPAERAIGREEWSFIADLTRVLVVAEKRRPAALRTCQAQEDKHRVAADVVVDVAPVRVTDRVGAVGAAAVARVRHPNTLREVGRWELERAALGQERLDFSGQRLQAEAGTRRRFHEAAWRRRRLRLKRCDVDESGEQAG